MRFPGFVGPSYQAASPNIDCQRSINLYPAVHESPNAKAPSSLIARPGLVEFCAFGGASPVRGILAAGSPTNNSERCFVVAGSKLFEVMADASYIELGDVGNDGFPVDMFQLSDQLMIVSAGQGYVHDGTTLFGAADDIPAARRGAFLDNYAVIVEPDSRNIYISDLNNFGTWDALDVGVKESHPDLVAAIVANDTDLWVFGERSREIWNNTGDADFPLQRNPSGSDQIGTVAIYSPVRFNGSVAWLGAAEQGGPSAYVAQGYQAVRVSTAAIEAEWEQYGTWSDSYSWTYSEQGHKFWCVEFPSVGRSWVYDASTKAWHERSWWNGTAHAQQRPRCHAYVYGQHLVGDRSNNKLYTMSPAELTDAGTQIRWQRTCPHANADDLKRMFYHQLQIDIDGGDEPSRAIWRRLGSSREPGRSRVFRLYGDSGSNQYTLDWSEDDGRTWKAARTVVAGAEDVRTVLVDAHITVTPGSA